jgi:PAS domain S-box-containing protein
VGNTLVAPAAAEPRRIEFDIDLQGRITAVSPVVENTTGYKADELIGMPLIALVHYEDLNILKDRWRLALTGEAGTYTIRLSGKYGEYRRVKASTRPRFDNGRAVGLTQVMTEVRRPGHN